jgi:hypothetical protein
MVNFERKSEQQWPHPNQDEIIPGTRGVRRRGDEYDELIMRTFQNLGIVDEHGNRTIDLRDIEPNS